MLGDFFEDRVLDWTVADARVCVHVMEPKRWEGEPLDDHLPDAMHAGTAAPADSLSSLGMWTSSETLVSARSIHGPAPL